MTLQNLRYVSEIAKYKSYSQAAKKLFLSQSTLSSAVKDLEEELGIQIFFRTNRGVVLTPDGEEFLRQSKDILERAELLALRYKGGTSVKNYFSVSAQHLPFSVRAFNEILEQLDLSEYDAAIRETTTNGVLYDVSTGKSELGILAVSAENLELLRKSITDYHLEFHELAKLAPYAFLRKNHPLSNRKSLSIEDLKEYPFVTYDQEDAPGFFTEEVFFYKPLKKNIHVSDRATKMYLIRNSDAFSIGVDLPNFNRDIYFSNADAEMAAVPIHDYAAPVSAGYLHHSEKGVSDLCRNYIELLTKHIDQLQLPGV